MTKVLILTAGYGEGHNAAARNLAVAFDQLLGPGQARVVDLFALASPRLNAVLRRGYLALINGSPRLWSSVYGWTDRSRILPRGLWMLRRETRLLAELVARERPDVICSTFPVYAFMLEKLALQQGLDVPHFNVVTDSISINSLWWRAACTGWFVPNCDSAEVLLRAGIERERVHVRGFPTPAFIAENPGLAPPDLTANETGRTAAGVFPRVLYIINSGTRGAAETARLLLAEHGWEITCAVGRDENLRRDLQQLADLRTARREPGRTAGGEPDQTACGEPRRTAPAHILGWTDQIPRLLLTHHLVVSKAGGATTQEAIAACCPMIVNQIVPGQEEGNYELLRRHGVGALATTPDAVVAACRRAFASQGAMWREWRTALAALSRPDAARDIAGHVLAQIEPGTGTVSKVAADLRAAVSGTVSNGHSAARRSAATL